MIDWVFVLTPVLVLPLALMFRFVGCGTILTIEPDPPSYRDYIMGEPYAGPVRNPGIKPDKADIIGYWRLVDADSSPLAKDEKGFGNGLYKTVGYIDARASTPTSPGSEGAAGDFQFVHDGLIVAEQTAECRFFRGGHVVVNYEPGLYTDEFTIEAWFEEGWGEFTSNGAQHTLFDAGGHYTGPAQSSPTYQGFSVFADANKRWQVRLGANLAEVFPSPPLVPLGARTHLAVTVEKDASGGTGGRRVTLYIDGKVAGTETVPLYTRPEGAPLVIGVTNAKADPALPLQPDQPVLGRVQEVILYRKPLSQEEIENHVGINRVA